MRDTVKHSDKSPLCSFEDTTLTTSPTDREIEIDRYNILDILDILDIDILNNDRGSFPLYFSKEVYCKWKTFCSLHPKSTAKLTESAFIYAMNAIPNENVSLTLDMTKDRETDFNNDVLRMICIDELESAIKGQHKPLHINVKKRFLNIFKKCYKVNNRGDRLDALMMEAKELFE